MYSLRNLLFSTILLLALLASAGCDSSNTIVNHSTLALNFSGLPMLGSGYVYEGWLIVGGAPVSTGRFTVNAGGTPSVSTFTVGTSDAQAASKFVLTIEPAVGDDPAPADTHILAGDFTAMAATLGVGDAAAFGTDFTSAAGELILNTPSTAADDTDFNQGIWWLDPAGAPDPTLTLPTLPDGWMYEGWVVVGGTPVTTGKFTAVSGADADGAGPTAGPDAVPPFPGQDYITPPIDLHGATAVISVEPDPDDGAEPFVLKPLVGAIPAGLAIGTLTPMTNNAAATNPTGTATLSTVI